MGKGVPSKSIWRNRGVKSAKKPLGTTRDSIRSRDPSIRRSSAGNGSRINGVSFSNSGRVRVRLISHIRPGNSRAEITLASSGGDRGWYSTNRGYHIEMGNDGDQHSRSFLTGFLYVYTRRRFRRRGDANITERHIWQTCASLCHSHSSNNSYSCAARRWWSNISRRTSSGSMSIVVCGPSSSVPEQEISTRVNAMRLGTHRAESRKQRMGRHGEGKGCVFSSSAQETHPTSSGLWKINGK